MLRRGLLILALLFAGTLAFADAAKHLVLKDGTYQSVTQYEIRGDRVRYLSAERFEWEEMPSNLIDWPATKKYEEDLAKGVSHDAAQIDKEVEAEKALEDAKTPEVAPSLRLPMQGGVFVMDIFRDTPQLVELIQNSSELGKDVKGDFIRRRINPFAVNKQKIEVAGPHAKTQVHVARPALFFNIDDAQTPDDDKKPTAGNKDSTEDLLLIPPKPEQRFRFVNMKPGKDSRQLGTLKTTITGKITQEQVFIPTHGELIGGGWVKITPEQDLAPGEYAIAEMLGDKEMNLYIWDFGVNPTAPENAAAWKPEVNAKPAPPKEPPKLEKRPPP